MHSDVIKFLKIDNLQFYSMKIDRVHLVNTRIGKK